MHHVDHRAVAVAHHRHHLVGKGDRLRFAGQLQRTGAQPVDAHHLEAGLPQALRQLRPRRVDGDAVVGHQNVDAGARRDAGGHLLHQRRDAPAHQRRNDDRQPRGSGGVAVATGRAAQHAVGAGQHVNVEAGVDFQRAQHHHVEPIDRRALGAEVGVLVGADFDMARVARQRSRRRPIEALHVQQLADQPFSCRSTMVEVMPPRANATRMPRARILSSRNRVTASEAPPVPVCSEKPSVK